MHQTVDCSVASTTMALRFDRKTGNLCSMCVGEREQVSSGQSRIVANTGGRRELVRNLSMNDSFGNMSMIEPELRLGSYRVLDCGRGIRAVVEQVSRDWTFTTSYTLDHSAPLMSIDIEVSYVGNDIETLDCLEWRSPELVNLDPPPGWGTIRSWAVRLFTGFGGLICAWRTSEGDNGTVEPLGSQILLTLYLSGRLTPDRSLRGGGFKLAFLPDRGPESLSFVSDQFARSGMSSFGLTPEWARQAHIYETFVGHWPMDGDGREYGKYSTVADLIADLRRIRELGLNTLYLMPRHPFPSYSIASFSDLGVQYGDGPGTSESIRDLVSTAHRLDIRVLLDIILHGVLDREALEEQQRRQAHFESEIIPTYDSRYEANVFAGDMLSHWIVYERAHAEAWKREVPPQHPLWTSHPEYFSKTKDGECQFTYTRSFNLRSPAFQEFFVQEMRECIEQFRVDGFRFDAPFWTWRQFDWSKTDGSRASWSAGGAIELIARTGLQLAHLKPEVCLYVESMDHNITRASHLQYTYDTYWSVIDSLGRAQITPRIAAQRLAAIQQTRVPGVIDINAVDSHDTCWWFPVGRKWARERYGITRSKLLYAVEAFLDGGIQLFAGGELDLERWLSILLHLREELPVLRYGAVDTIAVECDVDQIVPIWRRRDDEWLLALINFGRPTDVRVNLHERLQGERITSVSLNARPVSVLRVSEEALTVEVQDSDVVVLCSDQTAQSISKVLEVDQR